MTREILLIIIAIQLAWIVYRMEWKLWQERETEHFWKLVTPPDDKAVVKYFGRKPTAKTTAEEKVGASSPETTKQL